MTAPRTVVAAALLLTMSGPACAARAQAPPASNTSDGRVAGTLPDEGRYANASVPDITVQTTRGAISLSTLWQRGPVVLTLVFTRCAGVCSPFLRSLRSADEALGAPADVQRVVLSFDPRDTAAEMAQTAAHLGVADRAGWVFGVATASDVDRLTQALGFWSAWDDTRQQFDHPAMVVGIRQGRVARLLVGSGVSASRLGEVLRDARGQFVASYPLPGAVRFRCFDYDPRSGAVTLAPGALVLLVPAVGAAAATLGLFRRVRRGA